MNKIVRPKRAEGWNVSWNLNLFTTPRWTIVCGNCEATFKASIYLIDFPTVVCPYCHTVNKLDLIVGYFGDED